MKKTTKWITGSGISGKRSSLDDYEKVTSTLFSLHLRMKRMKRGWRTQNERQGECQWKGEDDDENVLSMKGNDHRDSSLEQTDSEVSRKDAFFLFCEWILISRLNKRIMCSFLCVRDTYTHTLVFIVSTDWSSFLAWKTPWNDGHTTK